jgi:hypothetical protein
MNLKYVRRSVGSMKALAWVSDEQIEQMQILERGDIMVPVTVTDQSNEEPIVCEMNWAWIEKQKS